MEHVMFSGHALQQWQAAHGLQVRFEADRLVMADTPERDWHLLRLERAAFMFRKVRLRLLVDALPSQDANIYIHHYGKLDIAEIAPDGTILNRGISLSLGVERRAVGQLLIEATFLNRHTSLSIGCARNCGVYEGSGLDQYAIRWIEVMLDDADALLRAVPDEERLRLVDVGGAGGLQTKWALHADRITPILFEPNPAEASGLRATIGRIPGGQVLECGLAHVQGRRTLHITEHPGCTSLLRPDDTLLQNYAIAPLFKIKKTEHVECVRYDQLHARGEAPAPDVIKIDVQGSEYEVLLGFGSLLQACLGVELESHFYRIYRNQKLLHDVVRLLDDFGLVLRKLEPVPHFDGDLVEVDTFFTRSRQSMQALGPLERRKFDLMRRVWELE
jgi:FkbM family methyltransferase